MNSSYLQQYVANHLRTRVRRFTPDRKLVSEFSVPGFCDDSFWYQRLIELYPAGSLPPGQPVFIAAGEKLIYAFSPGESYHYLIGPCLCEEETGFLYNLPVLPKKSETGTLDLTEPTLTYSVNIFPCTLLSLAEDTLLLFYADTPESAPTPLTPSALISRNCIEDPHAASVWKNFNRLLLHNMENNIYHNPYNQEIREYTALENGDVDTVRRIQKEDYNARRGLLSDDPVRQELYMGIVIITLSRSAAARGGVSPEACYSLSDAAIREMEACKDPVSVHRVARSTQLRYAMLVKEQKGNRPAQDIPETASDNLHISHCKDYIFAHLNQKLSVKMIAEAIGLEPNYLSALFGKCEKIPLKQYILREKINLARNMLAYSPYSYIEIANYLGFSSQSHLGEQFRRFTGMTLHQYRSRYGKEDFLQDAMSQRDVHQ